MNTALAKPSTDRIQLRSRFADVEVGPGDIVTFPDGLPGYESSRTFVVLDNPETAPMKILHAVDAEEPCFLTIDPRSVLPNYRCELSAVDRSRLGGDEGTGLLWMAVVTAGADGQATVNLRAPIVINPERMVGRQLMPNDCVYPLHFVLSDGR